jgi:amino acid permease
MHLRAPSIDRGVTSFLWALLFALYIWIGAIAVGAGKAPSFVIACICGLAIFVIVRLYGDDEPARRS